MACLLWMSGRSRQDIEMTLTQHMCETVAAGAVNQVRSRTIDLLPVVISVAEIIRDVDMAERQDDLMMRLDLRIQADLLSIARVFRGRLTHTEYLSQPPRRRSPYPSPRWPTFRLRSSPNGLAARRSAPRRFTRCLATGASNRGRGSS